MRQDISAARAPLAGFAVMGLYWGSMAGLMPQLKAHAQLSDEAFGAAMLISTCGALAAMLAAPKVERRLGRAALPLLSALLALAFLLPGLARNLPGFALSLALAAALVGLLDVVMNAQVAALEALRRRPLMNLAHGIYSFVYAGAAVAAGLARQGGAASVTVFLGAGLVTAALVAVMRSGAGRVPPAPTEAPRGAPGAWALLLAGGGVAMIAFLTEQGAEGWSALHLERNLGAEPAIGALGPALLGLCMGLGRLAGQGLSHRMAGPRLIALGGAMAAAGALLAALAPVLWLSLAGFAVMGLGVSVLVPTAFAVVGGRAEPEVRARTIARLSVVGYAGFFIGPPIMGLVSGAYGLVAAFATVAGLLALVPLALAPWLARAAR